MTTQPFPILTTDRLVLNELQDDDHSAIYQIFSNQKAMAFYDMEPLIEPNDGISMVSFLRNKFTTKTGIRWAIREKSPTNNRTKLIGTCGFNNWVDYDHSAIIGYELASAYWGKGYATEAIKKIITTAYKGELPIIVNRIEACVVPGNIGSEKVLKKNGFAFEGCLREKGFWDNQYQNMNLFSLIASDCAKT